MSEQVRINLGSGHWKFEGWVNVDLDRESQPDVCADLGGGLPFRSGSADYLHTEDFLDQLGLEQARRFLLECHRVLKPGGVIRILVPDLEKMARLYLGQPEQLVALWRDHVGIPLVIGTAGEVFNLGMRFAGHAFMYDGETFCRLLADCGFEARRVSCNQSEVAELRGLDLRGPDDSVSMYFDCYRLG